MVASHPPGCCIAQKIHSHSCFVYWSIVSLQDGIIYAIRDTFNNWKRKVLEKLDIDTLVDLFDNMSAEDSTVSVAKITPDLQGNPAALSF